MNNKFLSQFNSGYFFLFSIFFILFAAYFPAISTDYVFHDDVYYFGGWDKKSCRSFSQYHSYYYGIARPFGGLIKCFYGLSFDDITGAKYVRLFNLFLLTIYTTLFFRWLRYCNLEKNISYVIAVLTALLLPYQVTIIQITNAHHLSAAILALFAIKLSTDAVFSSEMIYKKRGVLLFLSVAVMCIANLIYPPAASLYWAFMAVYFFLKIKEIDLVSVKKLSLQASPALLSMLAPMFWSMRYGSNDNSKIDLNIIEKTKWLFNDILPTASSYWIPFAPGYFIYIFLFAILSAGLLFAYKNYRNFSSNFWLQNLIKLVFGFGFLVMTFFPMIILVKYMLAYRIFIAIGTLVLFYSLISFSYVVNNIRSVEMHDCVFKLLSSVMIIIAVSAVNYGTNKYYVKHSNLTYNFFKHKMLEIDWKNPTTKVHVVLSEIPYQTDKYRADEFGLTTTYWKDDVIPLMIAISNELELNLSYRNLYEEGVVTVGGEDIILGDTLKGQKVGKDRIIIDTNFIILRPYQKMNGMNLI